MKSLLSFLLLFIAGSTLFTALLCAIGNSSGGFLPNLGFELALWILGLGNVPVFFLNLVRWRLYGAPPWLKTVTVVQAAPAVVSLAILGQYAYDAWRESQTDAQVAQIVDAITADDPQRLVRAQAACGPRCMARLSLAEQLLNSAETGSARVAGELIHQSARVDPGSWKPRRQVRTCENFYLPDLDALSIAVVRNDIQMARLLLPVSTPEVRQEALWTAAQTDRLTMVQWLIEEGVPLSIRGRFPDENNTLLVAAASGAAVHVGRWLIESQHMPVNALVNGPDARAGKAPVRALYDFLLEVGITPEATDLLHQLIAHGADVDAPSATGDWPLEEAVRSEQKALVRLLLQAGANPALLKPAQRSAMEELLTHSDEPQYDRARPPDCIDTRGSASVGSRGAASR